MAIILGCNTLYPHDTKLTNERYFGLPELKTAIDTINNAGFVACEFSHYSQLNDDDRRAAGDYARAQGVRPWSAHAWKSIPAEADKLDEGVADLTVCLEDAAQLGVSLVVVHAAQGPDPLSAARWAVFREALIRLAPIAGRHNMRIGVENCYPREDLMGMAEVIHDLDLPEIGFVVDTGHAILRGHDAPPKPFTSWVPSSQHPIQDNQASTRPPPPRPRLKHQLAETWQALRRSGYQGSHG